MGRRHFTTLLGGAAVAWPLAARAQPATTPVVGFLSPVSPESIADRVKAFRSGLANAMRAHLAELGFVAAQGREGLKQLLTIIADKKDARLPIDARASLIVLAAQLRALHTMIGSIEKRLMVQHRANEASKRLQKYPWDRHDWRQRYCR